MILNHFTNIKYDSIWIIDTWTPVTYVMEKWRYTETKF